MGGNIGSLRMGVVVKPPIEPALDGDDDIDAAIVGMNGNMGDGGRSMLSS